jgi:elongation factor Ts
MAEISAKDVAALRKETGAGMMDCKRALEENDGDFEQARKWLREKGMASAAKRAGRAADQGAVAVAISGSVAAIVELNCETDFVAKGDEFKTAVATLATQAASDPSDLAAQAFGGSAELVDTAVKEMAARLGENISLGRVVRIDAGAGLIDTYVHRQEGRGTVGVIVVLSGVDPSNAQAQEIAHDVALHAASAAPGWLRRDDVPQAVIDAEREVYENITRNEGKPEAAIAKIVEARLGGFFRDRCLLEQAFVKDTKVSIAQLVATLGADATVSAYARVKIGEE